MCQFLSILKKPCANDPIPVYLHVIERTKVTVIPAATNTPAADPPVWNTVETDVTLDATLSAGEKWQAIEFRQRSADFILEGKGERDANQYKEQRLPLFYPESDPEAMYKLGVAVGWEGIVSFLNGNGARILWGTLANPVELSKADFNASKGGWDVEFIRMSPAAEGSPPFYTGAIEV